MQKNLREVLFLSEKGREKVTHNGFWKAMALESRITGIIRKSDV